MKKNLLPALKPNDKLVLIGEKAREEQIRLAAMLREK